MENLLFNIPVSAEIVDCIGFYNKRRYFITPTIVQDVYIGINKENPEDKILIRKNPEFFDFQHIWEFKQIYRL